MTLRRVPAFASEEEESNWWYDNRDKHAEEFLQAYAEGRVSTGRLADRIAAAKKATAVTLTAEDALNALRIAEQRGIEVQAYLSSLIHNGLKTDLRSLLQAQDEPAQSNSEAALEDARVPHLLQR